MPDHTIAENLARLQAARTAIANAITAKGGTVMAGDGLEDFAADIATISSSDIEQLEPYDFPDIFETPADYEATVCLKYENASMIILLFSVARKQTKSGTISFKLDIGAHGNEIFDTKIWGSGSTGTSYSVPSHGSCNITDSGGVLTIKASISSSIGSPRYQLLAGVVLWLKQ